MYTLNYGFDSQLKADSPPDSPGIAEFRVIPADSRDSGQNSRNSVDSSRNQWRNEKYWATEWRELELCTGAEAWIVSHSLPPLLGFLKLKLQLGNDYRHSMEGSKCQCVC
jgi:hypothetical protein